MEKKISAVEWYENRIFILQIQLENKEISLGEYAVTRVELFKQAKAMEKEQIIEAHFTSSGCNSFDVATDRVNSAYKAAQIYYQETYEQN